MSKFPALFNPLKVGAIGLAPNRVFMAPLTRCRAIEDSDHVPSKLMVDYYSQRASAGLIIAEFTMVTKDQSTFWTEPGIWSQEQVQGWKVVTEAVKAKGGNIVLQIAHGGRTCHPLNNKQGLPPKGPSAIRIDQIPLSDVFNPTLKAVPYADPLEMTLEDIESAKNDFLVGAKNAIAAGFSGVEVHGANGYLLDEFLRTSSNTRKDHYGGSLENRARLLLEVVDLVGKAIGYDRVGVRLSPLNSYQNMVDEDPIALTKYVAKQLSDRQIAYLHVMRADFFQVQKGDVITPARENFKGVLIGNMGYTGEEADAAVQAGALDAVTFGTAFLANPDLPQRLRTGAELNAPKREFFYTHKAEGYTDYPFLSP